jgi:beta-glucosidase/6-phospho-beta-glucosidase/beta-galactosidase
MCPELGGSEEFLDILGFNYYWNCQWSVDGQTLEWPEQTHKIRKPLSILLQSAYKRYRKPIFLSETGHFGTGRVEWMDEITQECEKAIKNGVDFNGICIYPVIDRPDWDNLLNYSQCGIWDLNPNGDRLPNLPYINCIKNAQEKFQQPIGIIDYVLTLLKQII